MSDNSNIQGQSPQFSTFKNPGLQLPGPSKEVSEIRSFSTPASPLEKNKDFEQYLTFNGRLQVEAIVHNDEQSHRKLSQRKKISSFVKRALSAKNSFELDDKKMGKTPASSTLNQEELNKLQVNLCQRLAELYAAVAVCDDVTLNLPAVANIKQSMTQITRDARTLSSCMDCEQQVSLLDQVRELCDASNRICDSVINSKVLPSIDSSDLLPAMVQLHNASAQLESHLLPAAQHKRLQSNKQLLKNVLEKLVEASSSVGGTEAPDKRYMRQLSASAAVAKESLIATRQLLDEPIAFQLMKKEDHECTQQQFHRRLSQLSAAIVSVDTGVNTTRNYSEAIKAINAIKELTPLVVKDGRALCATKTGSEKIKFMENFILLCDITTEICKNAENSQSVADTGNAFRDATKNLVALTNPYPDLIKAEQIITQTSHVHNHACTLADKLNRIAQQLDYHTAAMLVSRGKDIVDTANKLTAIAQVLAPALKDINSSHELLCAVTALRHVSASPDIINKLPKSLQQILQTYRQQLRSSLDQLVIACYLGQDNDQSKKPLEDAKDAQIAFKESTNEAIKTLQALEFQMKQPSPMVTPTSKEDVKPIKQRLEDQRSRLDAAFKVLNEAVVDANPNYTNADESIKSITNLMPLIIKDAHKLVTTDEASKIIYEEVDAKYKSVKNLVRALSAPNERTDEIPTASETIYKENIKMPNNVMSELRHKINKGNKTTTTKQRIEKELIDNHNELAIAIQKQSANTAIESSNADTEDKVVPIKKINKMPSIIMRELENKIKTDTLPPEKPERVATFPEKIDKDNAVATNEQFKPDKALRTDTEDKITKTNKEKMPNQVMMELQNKIKAEPVLTKREIEFQNILDGVYVLGANEENKKPDDKLHNKVAMEREETIKESTNKMPTDIMCELKTKLNTGNKNIKETELFIEELKSDIIAENSKQLAHIAYQTPETETEEDTRTNKENMPAKVMMELQNKMMPDSLGSEEQENEQTFTNIIDGVSSIPKTTSIDERDKIEDYLRDEPEREKKAIEDKNPKLVMSEMTSKLNTALLKLQRKSPEQKCVTSTERFDSNTTNILTTFQPVHKKEVDTVNIEPRIEKDTSATQNNSPQNNQIEPKQPTGGPNDMEIMITQIEDVMYLRAAVPDYYVKNSNSSDKTKENVLNEPESRTNTEPKKFEEQNYKIKLNDNYAKPYKDVDIKPKEHISKFDSDVNNGDKKLNKNESKPISPDNDISVDKVFNDRLTAIKEECTDTVADKVSKALKEAEIHLLTAKNALHELISSNHTNLLETKKSTNMEKINDEVENLEKLLQELKQNIRRTF